MKVEKKELEEITQGAIAISMKMLALLALTRCPFSELYGEIEKFVVQVDDLRERLEMNRLSPPEVKAGLVSKLIEKIEAVSKLIEKIEAEKAAPADTSQMN